MENLSVSSVGSSSASSSTAIEDIVNEEPMYYVLTQFLETPEGKNIATCIEHLTSEVRSLRLAIEADIEARNKKP